MSQRVTGHVRTLRRAVPRPHPHVRRQVHVLHHHATDPALLLEEVQLLEAVPVLPLLKSGHRNNVRVSGGLHRQRQNGVHLPLAHVVPRKTAIRQPVFLSLPSVSWQAASGVRYARRSRAKYQPICAPARSHRKKLIDV